MNLNIKNFIDINKRIFIWIVFFGLIYLVRNLFGLVFVTFILCYIFHNVTTWLCSKTRLGRRMTTILIYIVFLTLISILFSKIGPKLSSEFTTFVKQLPQTIDHLYVFLDHQAENQPSLAPLLLRIKEVVSIESIAGMDRQALISFLLKSFNQVTTYFSYFLLGILFSFLILFDFPNLKGKIQALQETRLREIYEETAHSVIQFALTVGSAFQAQFFIALLNTCFTGIGLYILGISPIPLLSSIVFLCGFIPVLGLFISSVPIILMGINLGGPKLALLAVLMITIVHTIEAYILNPRIYSAVFKINPVLTLMILYIGHTFFGVWGMLLGIPVSVYIFRHALLGKAAIPEKPCAEATDY